MLLVFSDQPQKEIDMKNVAGGPFLQTAVFCEKVLQEKDGVISAIRIIDRFIISLGEGAPESMPPITIPAIMLVTFKSGDVTGKYELKVRPISPSGKDLAAYTLPFMLAGGERSANLVINYALKAEEEGIYWFDVMIGDKSFTKMSLNLVYQRTPAISTTSSPVN